MTPNTFRQEIENAVPKLLELARESSWNKISNNCKFILTEIKDSTESLHKQRLANNKENSKKIPVLLSELMPKLLDLYWNFYDINLEIHKAQKSITIIDFRYYPKSSLDRDYLQKVLKNDPMIHCKVAIPWWLIDKKEKFDINWQHKQWRIKWKLFWLRQKLNSNSG